ncbi:MAG: LptF/LptG family permease [Planctomycetota bacterium]|nr:LptF/LptG family permease [Planctomycetota bacterium]
MLRIQRALLAELLFIWLLITAVVTTAVFVGVSARFLGQGGGALGGAVLAELLPRLLPMALTYSVPFSWLAATALVLGRWVSDHEVVALKSAGVPPRVIAVPLLAFAALLSVGGMWFNGFVVPEYSRTLRASLRESVPQFLSSLRGADRVVTFDLARLSFERWDPAERAFIGVELDQRERDGTLKTKIVMQRLRLERLVDREREEGLSLDIEKAYIVQTPGGAPEVSFGGRKPLIVGRVERVGASTFVNELIGGHVFRYRPRHLTVREIIYGLEAGGIIRGNRTELAVALHGRLALGSASFFLGLFALAVMLWLQPSSHRVRDFMLCFAPAVLVFFPLNLAGPSIAKSTPVPAWLAMWSPHLILLAVSLVLLYRGGRR